jgi:hypothetical protein
LQILGPAVVQNNPQMAECFNAITNNLVALSR